MKKFECTVCHHVAEGVAPEVCPVCKQAGKFVALNPLKGSKTEANLQAAFAGESQARNKYTYFASNFLYLSSCSFSIAATPSNNFAISSKPSSRATFANS